MATLSFSRHQADHTDPSSWLVRHNGALIGLDGLTRDQAGAYCKMHNKQTTNRLVARLPLTATPW